MSFSLVLKSFQCRSRAHHTLFPLMAVGPIQRVFKLVGKWQILKLEYDQVFLNLRAKMIQHKDYEFLVPKINLENIPVK